LLLLMLLEVDGLLLLYSPLPCDLASCTYSTCQ
jgi:hypothetical protein